MKQTENSNNNNNNNNTINGNVNSSISSSSSGNDTKTDNGCVNVLRLPKPPWLRVRSRFSDPVRIDVEKMLKTLSLHTVCEEAACPNLPECFGRRTATFMILGRVCTRNCTFCNVEKACPENVSDDEPKAVATAVESLGLLHVVITSVTRDDLADGGAAHFAAVTEAVRVRNPDTCIELLIPDFRGDFNALRTVTSSRPHIIGHNVETVPRLYPEVRPMASYKRSLEVLRNIKEEGGIYSKSGIMVGFGEKEEEVLQVMKDLRGAGCDFLTVGQYLAPSQRHHPVIEYIHPEIFEKYGEAAKEYGFLHVASAPLVRSSYMAERAIGSIKKSVQE